MKLSIKKGRNWKNILFFSILVIVVIVVLNLFPKQVRNFFYLISAPIQKNFWYGGEKISDFFEVIFRTKDLNRENKELKLKIQALEAENVALRELKKENEILRGALEIDLEKEFKLTLASAIGKDIAEDFILIDKGAKDGILENLPVITQQKVLIGRIGYVYRNFSKVFLISHPKSSFGGKVQENEIFGLVKGKGNFKISFELIPKEKEIKEGDLVITSALSEIFPVGLVVGKISQVKKSDLESFQMAEIQPGFNIKDLEKLFIIIER